MKMIQLRDGPLLRENAVLFALDLEANGVRMRVQNHKIIFDEDVRLTPEQKQKLSGFAWDLVNIMEYAQNPPEPR